MLSESRKVNDYHIHTFLIEFFIKDMAGGHSTIFLPVTFLKILLWKSFFLLKHIIH